MRHPIFFGFLSILLLLLSLTACLKTPSNPSENPMNVSVTLFYPDEDNTVKAGVIKQLGLEVALPQHISGINLSSSCGDVDTVIVPLSENQTDTMYLPLVFDNEGTCTLMVTAELLDERINEKTDKLVLHVLPGIPRLTFSVTPDTFTTHTGISDTLRFVTETSQIDDIDFKVNSNPDLDSNAMFLIEPVAEDTVLISFDPSEASTYTVTLTAIADTLTATASVTVTVLSSFTPSETDNPQTLITGITDTLIYTLTEEQIANGITMELLDAENLPDVAAVIPSGNDSLLIAVIPGEEGSLSFSIATTNGDLTDTTQYTFTFINATDIVWSGMSVSMDATEGAEKTVDLTHYFFTGVTLDDITLGAETGSIDNSGTWHFTPSWGTEATLTVTITAKRGENVEQDLSISLTVAPGDDTDPVITLLSPASESKIVSSSQVTVSVNITDEGAGVDNVTFTTSDTTINGTKENDSTFSAVITGLIEDTATDVIITAVDKSMNGNNSSKTVTLTYDPTMEDTDAPVFSHVYGPQSGDRITMGTGKLTYAITDDSGVDSVWWTLNDEFVSTVSALENNEYTVAFELTGFGANTLVIHAKDASSSGNEGSRTVTLVYNTEPTAINLTAPVDNATDVPISPTFKWSGGDDADGDGVTFKVNYGTSENNLTGSASVSGKTATVSGGLDYNTTYFWRATGTIETGNYNDQIVSEVFTFTTVGQAPVISEQLSDQTVNEDGILTLSIETVGIPDPDMYRWYHNGMLIDDENSAIFSKTGVSANDAGDYYVEVFNDVGSVISETVKISVRLKPQIVSQTSSLYSVVEGSSVTMEIALAGTPPFIVSWNKNGNEVQHGSITTTTTTFSFTAALSDDGCIYSCMISNDAGFVSSDDITLAVTMTPPIIVVQPSDVNVLLGDEISLNVSASGHSLTYQWGILMDEIFSPISGANGDSYSIDRALPAYNGEVYCCRVSNAGGSVLSNPATVTVTPEGMVLIPAGSFYMGGGARVTISNDFWMDRTEVTDGTLPVIVTWYEAVLRCNNRSKTFGLDTIYSYISSGSVLENVIIHYERNGFRLPTEAEWEYAYRAGTTTDYYWGEDYDPYPETANDSIEIDDYAKWFNGGSSYQPDTVGQRQANDYGLFDMAGNAREWCNDWEGAVYPPTSNQIDPIGPENGASKILRGGSSADFAEDLTAISRKSCGPPEMCPQFSHEIFGFRMILPTQF